MSDKSDFMKIVYEREVEIARRRIKTAIAADSGELLENRSTLTEAEHGAVERASAWLLSEMWADSEQAAADAATLRGLLERLA